MFIARLSGDVTVFPDHNSDENQTCILLPCEESTIGSHITPKAWLSAIADQKGKVRRLVPWRTCLIAGNMYDAQTGRLVGHASASHLTSEDRKYHQLESIGDEVDIGKGCTKPIFCDKHDRSFQCVDDRPTSTDFENWGDVQAELMVIRSWAMDMMRDAHHQLHRPYILGGYDRNVFIPGEDIIYDGDRLKLQADYRYETKILDKPGMLAGTAFYYGPDDWISMSFIPVGARKGTQKNSQGMFVCSNNQRLVNEIMGFDEYMLSSRSVATFDDLYIAPSLWEGMPQETQSQIDFRVSFRTELNSTINIFKP